MMNRTFYGIFHSSAVHLISFSIILNPMMRANVSNGIKVKTKYSAW